MPGTREELDRFYRSAAAEGIERLYELLGGLLQRTATHTFHVPEDEAQALVRDVFTAYIASAATVNDPEAWLIAAVCHSARAYQRRHGSSKERRPDTPVDAATVRTIRDISFLQEAMATLPDRAREAVRLRFAEHLSYAEIVAHLGVSEFYVQNTIKQAVLKLRKMQRQQRR